MALAVTLLSSVIYLQELARKSIELHEVEQVFLTNTCNSIIPCEAVLAILLLWLISNIKTAVIIAKLLVVSHWDTRQLCCFLYSKNGNFVQME